jgi:hypothetical protein
MTNPVKALVVLVALGTMLAAPALAQQAPHPRQNAAASHAQWQNNNTNPDFQFGGER